MIWIILGLFSAVALLLIIDNHRQKRRRRTAYAAAIRAFEAAPENDRTATMLALTKENPDNAAAWYLLGAMHLRQGEIRDAARAFGNAYHRNCNFESAALMTFACLKSQHGDIQDFLEQVARTWQEMKRPVLLENEKERAVFSALASGNPLPRLSVLGQVVWGMTGPRHQQHLMDLIQTAAGRDFLAPGRA